MNPEQVQYIRDHYRSQSAGEMARRLNAPKKKVHQIIRQLQEKENQQAASREQEAPAVSSRSRIFHLAFALLALALTAGVYAKSLSYPFINWDDPNYVSDNPDIRSLGAENIKRFFTRTYVSLYAPVTMLSFALDYQIYQNNPFGYHLTNVLLHGANALLVYLLLILLTRDRLLSAAVSLLFIVHPAQAESVVWISQRKNVLSFFFLLVSFLFYVLYRSSEKKRALFYVLCFITFIVAVLAKALSVILPLLFILYDYCFKGLDRKKIWGHLPFVLTAAVLAWGTVVMAHEDINPPYFGGSPYKTFLAMSTVMMKYFQVLLLPVNLSILYVFPVYHSPFEPAVMLSLLALGLLCAGTVYLARRNRPLFFWAGWYIAFLLPVLNIVPQLVLMQDRWLYLPLVGFFTLLFYGLHKKTGRRVLITTAAVFIVFFSFLNLKRQTAWSSPETLWLETQKVTRGSYTSPIVNLGNEYLRQGKTLEAIREFEKILAKKELPEAYAGLGTAFLQQKNPVKAMDYLEKAIRLQPNVAEYYNQLGLVYRQINQPDMALKEYDKAIAIYNESPEYHNNRGVVLAMMGRKAEAEQAFKRSLELYEDFPDALVNYFQFLLANNRFEEAVKYGRHFLKKHPSSPYRQFVSESLSKYQLNAT